VDQKRGRIIKEVDEYDEKTCITACELRAAGVPIPDSIPDCGWVLRTSIKWGVGPATAEDNSELGVVSVCISAEFTKPFTWIRLEVEAADERGD
jgi:hypothetical protein